ncbi:MAG: hypothetical protein ABSF71_08030 [Terriglobia bacterium]
METSLDRIGKIIAILAGLTAIGGTLVGFFSAVNHPQVQLRMDKDRNRIPPLLLRPLTAILRIPSTPDKDKISPVLLSQLTALDTDVLDEYQDPNFGSVTLDVINRTASEVKPMLELGGLKKFIGVEVVDSPLQGKFLEDYKAELATLTLQPGTPCPSRVYWPDRGNKKLDLPLPSLGAYAGHITLAVYGLPFEGVGACVIDAPADVRYLLRVQDSYMLQHYPIWLVTLSLVLLVTAALLFVQSKKTSVK